MITTAERIIAAAIQLESGRIFFAFPPARHPTVMLDAQAAGEPLACSTQGFVTSDGRFVTRSEAYVIALAAG